MSNTGLPRALVFARCTLLVWHTFISPQLSSPQVIYKKLPRPEIVSCVQSARRSGFPHDLQPPSSSFANKSSSTTRLPITGNSDFEKERTDVFALSTISTLSLSFLFSPCHKFPPLFSNHAFPKRPFFSRESFPARKAAITFMLPITCYYAQYRMRSAILRNHLNIGKRI